MRNKSQRTRPTRLGRRGWYGYVLLCLGGFTLLSAAAQEPPTPDPDPKAAHSAKAKAYIRTLVKTERIAQVKTHIRALEAALLLYRLDNHHFPTTTQGLAALVNKPSGAPQPKNYREGGYLRHLPKDPWGNDYVYLSPGKHGDIDLYSLGEDLESADDNVGNWNLAP